MLFSSPTKIFRKYRGRASFAFVWWLRLSGEAVPGRRPD
jgi:hypothetical protein